MNDVNRYGNALDVQGLSRLRADLKNPTPESAKAVAQQFESLFVQQMLQSMRAASPGDSLFGGGGEGQYRDLLDKQLSMTVSQGRGLGLAPVIERQLLANMGLQQTDTPALNTSLADYARRPTATRPRPQAPTEQATAPAQTAGLSVGDKGAAWGSPADFVKGIWKAAEGAAAKLGVPVKALVAQAALETGWGKHVIRRGDGDSSHNLFGIKSHRGWSGDSVKVPTLEYRDGVAAREMASFRAYGSLEDCFEDYARFLQSNPRYGKALEAAAAADADGFVQELQNAGYATDPNYAEKIRKIMQAPAISDAETESSRSA